VSDAYARMMRRGGNRMPSEKALLQKQEQVRELVEK